MKFSTLIAASALSLATAMPAAAHVEQYSTLLTGGAEIPANASPATGSALVTVDFDLVTMRVQASFSGLQGNTSASHIHCCTTTPGSVNVGVATQQPSFTGFPLGVTSGTFDNTFDMTLASSYNPAFVTAQGSIGNAFNALVAGMATGNAYYNIHTSVFPGGEIRGLLVVTPVPEPEIYAMLVAGLGLVTFVARRRKRIAAA